MGVFCILEIGVLQQISVAILLTAELSSQASSFFLLGDRAYFGGNK